MKKRFNFDREYFERYYRNPQTRVTTARERAALCGFVFAYARHLLGRATRSVLDLGCGLGDWRRELRKHHPRARYVGVEVSEYLCRRYGWEHASVGEFKTRDTFDLVVCQGVLQYLSAHEAEKAVENLAHLCTSIMYFETLTKGDVELYCDPERSDTDVYTRTARWYANRLRTHFHNAGGGVWIRKGSDIGFFELEVFD